jgi:hypothetical protein
MKKYDGKEHMRFIHTNTLKSNILRLPQLVSWPGTNVYETSKTQLCMALHACTVSVHGVTYGCQVMTNWFTGID